MKSSCCRGSAERMAICKCDETLEWMLTPESVGTFIEVGDDDPGLLHRLVGSGKQPEKHELRMQLA